MIPTGGPPIGEFLYFFVRVVVFFYKCFYYTGKGIASVFKTIFGKK